jgi:hypothetical protein
LLPKTPETFRVTPEIINFLDQSNIAYIQRRERLKKRRGKKMQYNVKDLKGFSIGATDGDIGKLDDFYFDDESWTIRYLVAETGNWLQNRKVLISPFALGKADLSRKRLNVTLTKKQVEESPSIDTDKPVSRHFPAARGIISRLLRLPILLGWPLFVGTHELSSTLRRRSKER